MVSGTPIWKGGNSYVDDDRMLGRSAARGCPGHRPVHGLELKQGLQRFHPFATWRDISLTTKVTD